MGPQHPLPKCFTFQPLAHTGHGRDLLHLRLPGQILHWSCALQQGTPSLPSVPGVFLGSFRVGQGGEAAQKAGQSPTGVQPPGPAHPR